VRALYGQRDGRRSVVLLGNSQMEAAARPLVGLGAVRRPGGGGEGRIESLCVFATAPTDWEVIARALGPLRPELVLIGLSAPDLGTTLERARTMPIVHLLDVGFRSGLVPPADLESRLDRWARTVWHLYRYRMLFHDLLLPASGPRTPQDFLDTPRSPLEVLAMFHGGPERGQELLAARQAFLDSHDPAAFLSYVARLRGPDYLPGLRERWQTLAPQALQLQALRGIVTHVRAAGGEPVWVLLPENPLLERDPVIGDTVHERSDEIAALLGGEAGAQGVALVDLRRTFPPERFLDLNHLFYEGERFGPVLAAALAARPAL
jgi:hypothetical protein